MKNLITLIFVYYVILTLTSCANNEPPTASKPQTPITNPLESIEFSGETYLISEADYTTCDENGNVNFVLFNDIGFIGLADNNKEPVYQQVKSGQVIGGATVADGTSMGFDFINGKWELTESDVSFTGSMTFIGELTKTPDGELQMFAPGTLTFTVTESKSGFVPFKYGFDNAPQFMLDGYDPDVDYPELFNESDTVYVKATFDWIRLLKTDRATGVDRAKLVGVELLEPLKTQSITFPANKDDGEIEDSTHIYEIEPFDLSIALPDGWSFGRWPLAGGYDFITVFSKLNFFNEKKECVGVIGYNIYEPYEGVESDPRAIYNQIALGNNYHFDVRDSYEVVNETNTGITAVADVYYAAAINDGVEKINKGIVSYNTDLLVYIAAEFNADKITDEQILSIAKSIQFARNEYHGLTKEEYEDLQAQKAKYEAMTDKQKQIARESGTVGCKKFVHLWWEESIDTNFIDYVGSEAFNKWINEHKDSGDCLGIYSFADEFGLDLNTLKTIITENHLEEFYPLDRLETRYNYFIEQ